VNYFLKLIRTSRPLLWFTHFTLFTYGGLQSHSFQLNSFQFIWGLLIFSLPFSLFVYAINDYYDLRTDLLNSRKGTIFGEKHKGWTIKNLRIWGFAGLVITLILTQFMSIYVSITMLILCCILYAYSALPLRLKSVPIIDAFVGGFLYSYLITIIGYFFFVENEGGAISVFKSQFIFFGLFGLAGHLMGAVLDEEPDRKDNIRTSVVSFGINRVITFCLVILLISLYLARGSLLFIFFMSISIAICSLCYSDKWRKSFFSQKFVAYLSLIFFAITIILYFVKPTLLRF